MKNILCIALSFLFCISCFGEDQTIENDLPPYSTLSFDLNKCENTKKADSFFSFSKIDEDKESSDKAVFSNPFIASNFLSSKASPFFPTCYFHWHHYKAHFGFEKAYIRFPHEPTISHGNGLIVAYAYEHNVLYSLTGYFPPVINIEPVSFFETALFNASQYPYLVLNYAIYQADCYFVLDYIMHDTIKDMIIKNRTVVTPFNAYTLQAVSPYGHSTRFDYFIDSFKIKLAN